MSLFQLSWVNRFGVLNSGSLWNIKVTKPSKTFPNHLPRIWNLRFFGCWWTSPWGSFAAWRVVFGSNVMAKPLVSWNAGACVKHSQRPLDPFQMHAVSSWVYANLWRIWKQNTENAMKCSLDEMKTKPWNLGWCFLILFLWLKWTYHPYFFELKRFNENLQKNERQSCKLYTFTTYKRQNIRPSHGYPVKGHKVGPY